METIHKPSEKITKNTATVPKKKMKNSQNKMK